MLAICERQDLPYKAYRASSVFEWEQENITIVGDKVSSKTTGKVEVRGEVGTQHRSANCGPFRFKSMVEVPKVWRHWRLGDFKT